MDRNISKTCVFIFHHSIEHDEASGYTFIVKLIAQINIFKLFKILEKDQRKSQFLVKLLATAYRCIFNNFSSDNFDKFNNFDGTLPVTFLNGIKSLESSCLLQYSCLSE